MLTIDKCKRLNIVIMPCFKCFYQPWCEEGQLSIKEWRQICISPSRGNFERDEFLDLFYMETFKADRPTKREIERKFDV